MTGALVTLGSHRYRLAPLSVGEILDLRPEMEAVASIKTDQLITDRQMQGLARIIHASLLKNHPRVNLKDVPNMLGGGNASEALAAALAADPVDQTKG